MKDIHPILRYGILVAIIATMGYLRYIDAIDNSNFITLVILCAVGVLLALVMRRKTLIKQQEALLHDKEQALKSGNGKDGENASHLHVSKTVKLRPTFAGMCSDVIAAIALIASWILILRKGLLVNGTNNATFIIVLFSIIALGVIAMSYMPKTYGGMNELLGLKQVKLEVIREHANGLACALLVLAYTLRLIAPTSTVVEVLMLISIPAVFGTFFWKYFIKKVQPSQEDLLKRINDEP